MNDKETQKAIAAKKAVEHIETDQIVGIGSGSTIEYFIRFLKDKMISEKLNILAVPTSYQSAIALIKNEISLTSLNEYSELDLAIDGADEIDPKLNLIKGGGGAMTQEKIVDSAAKTLIIIADESKCVKNIGEKMPIPLEVVPLSLNLVLTQLKRFTQECNLRQAIKKMGPVITDNGNFIIDAKINKIPNLKSLELELNGIPGVIENGLFVEMANIAYIGTKKEVIKLTR